MTDDLDRCPNCNQRTLPRMNGADAARCYSCGHIVEREEKHGK